MGGRIVAAAVSSAVLLIASVCASGDDSSFTSLAAADLAAREWVDTAVTSAIPGSDVAEGHSEGPDSCTTSPDFSEMSYSLTVEVPAEQVDEYTEAVWQAFQSNGFFGSRSRTVGTAPDRPGPGSPSWTINLFHDGFQVEITGARRDPTRISTYIITPCLKTT